MPLPVKVYAACLGACPDVNLLNREGLAPIHWLVLREQPAQRLAMLIKASECTGSTVT